MEKEEEVIGIIGIASSGTMSEVSFEEVGINMMLGVRAFELYLFMMNDV